MRRYSVIIIGIVALIGVLIMLQLTTPSGVGLFGVLAFFILLYVFVACLLYVVLNTVAKILSRILPKGRQKSTLESVSRMKVYYYSSLLALAPVILVGMNSIGTVGFTDILLLILFEILGCLYISRRF